MKDNPVPYKKCFKILLYNNRVLILIKMLLRQILRINKNNKFQISHHLQTQRTKKLVKIN